MKRRYLLIGAAFLLSQSVCGHAANVEVVQSVPLETNLSIPGIRETQAVWIEMIESAKSTLDLEQFYVSDQSGEALAPVLQAIQEAASRGVHVRLLVDAKFYSTYPDSVNQIAATHNCEARKIDFSSYGGVQHAKYFVVDGQQAFVGSQNFDWRALSHIHEVGLRIDDSDMINGLESIFEKDWNEGTSNSTFLVTAPGRFFMDSELTLVASPAAANPPGITDSITAVTDLIASAQNSIKIQVMEYTTKNVYNGGGTWSILDQAIRKAASRGVHVQLMVDVSSLKSGSKDLKALAKVSNVEVMSVTIPQYSGGKIDYARLIHSKYMVVDGAEAWVGTENWSESYFMQTRDVGLIVTVPDAVSRLDQIFDHVWTSGYGAKL